MFTVTPPRDSPSAIQRIVYKLIPKPKMPLPHLAFKKQPAETHQGVQGFWALAALGSWLDVLQKTPYFSSPEPAVSTLALPL